MSKLKNRVIENQLRIVTWTGVLFLIAGFSLWFYANSVIHGHEQLLDTPNLTLEETWCYEGSLQWWRAAYTTRLLPVTVILASIGLVALLCPFVWISVQERRAVRIFTENLIRASAEKSRSMRKR